MIVLSLLALLTSLTLGVYCLQLRRRLKAAEQESAKLWIENKYLQQANGLLERKLARQRPGTHSLALEVRKLNKLLKEAMRLSETVFSVARRTIRDLTAPILPIYNLRIKRGQAYLEEIEHALKPNTEKESSRRMVPGDDTYQN